MADFNQERGGQSKHTIKSVKDLGFQQAKGRDNVVGHVENGNLRLTCIAYGMHKVKIKAENLSDKPLRVVFEKGLVRISTNEKIKRDLSIFRSSF